MSPDLKETPPNMEDIKRAITDNSEAISKVEAKLDAHIAYNKKHVDPIVLLMDDIAAVGRVGRWAKSVVVWFIAIGGAVTAAYHGFNNFGGKH